MCSGLSRCCFPLFSETWRRYLFTIQWVHPVGVCSTLYGKPARAHLGFFFCCCIITPRLICCAGWLTHDHSTQPEPGNVQTNMFPLELVFFLLSKFEVLSRFQSVDSWRFGEFFTWRGQIAVLYFFFAFHYVLILNYISTSLHCQFARFLMNVCSFCPIHSGAMKIINVPSPKPPTSSCHARWET